MSNLDSHVPDLDRCRRMAAVPALREAFRGSFAFWNRKLGRFGEVTDNRVLRCALTGDRLEDAIPAPLVDEMLAWLFKKRAVDWMGYGIGEFTIRGNEDVFLLTDPNQVADACLAAAGESE